MVNVNNRRNPAIYALHTGDHRYFYVGSTSKNSDNRLYEHIYRAHTGHKAPLYVWMRDVGIRNVQVVDLALIEDMSTRAELEAEWIARMIADGHPLTNQVARDGVPNSMSEQSKARVSKANRGKPTWIKGKRGADAGWTDERRRAQAETIRKRQHSAA